MGRADAGAAAPLVGGAGGAASRRWIPVACLGAALAFALTGLAPGPALLVAPLLFGVPHVLGDLWVLLLRPGAPRAAADWIAAPLAVLVALRAAQALGVAYPAWIEVAVGTLGVLLGAASTRSRARVLVALAACAPAWLFIDRAALVLAHLHNAVAVMLVLAWGPRAVGLALAALSGAGTVAILGGALDGRLTAFAGLEPSALARAIAPGLDAPAAERWVLAFCFAQLVHYLCWVALLPSLLRDGARGEGRAGVPPRGADAPVRPYWAALRADLGVPLLALGAAGALALPFAGVWDPVRVRAGYLSIVLFHGWLELSVLAAWRPGSARARAPGVGGPR